MSHIWNHLWISLGMSCVSRKHVYEWVLEWLPAQIWERKTLNLSTFHRLTKWTCSAGSNTSSMCLPNLHIPMSHDPHMNVVSHIFMCLPNLLIRISHIPHINTSCHTSIIHVSSMCPPNLHVWKRHIPHMNTSYYTCFKGFPNLYIHTSALLLNKNQVHEILHTYESCVALVNSSCHTWMKDATRINEACQIVKQHTCIYVYMCVCVYTYMKTYIYMYIYIYTCIYIHIYTYAYTNMCVYPYHIHEHSHKHEYTSICVYMHTWWFLSTQHKQGAGRHLPQIGQAVEDALRHARQLVPGQHHVPVDMTDMSWRMYMHSVSLCTDRFCVSEIKSTQRHGQIDRHADQGKSVSFSHAHSDTNTQTQTRTNSQTQTQLRYLYEDSLY